MHLIAIFLGFLSILFFVILMIKKKERKHIAQKLQEEKTKVQKLKDININLKQNLKKSIEELSKLNEQNKHLKNSITILQIRNTNLKFKNKNFQNTIKTDKDNENTN